MFVEGLRLRLTVRRVARVTFAGALFVLLSGLFSGAQVGCLLPETYVCGNKNSYDYCWSFTQQADCQTHPICEWRVGCASGCRRATNDAECSQHLFCEVVGVPQRCFRNGCQDTSNGGYIMTEAQCTAAKDCNWEPSCWDAPNTDCDVKLCCPWRGPACGVDYTIAM